MQRISHGLGLNIHLDQSLTLRFPPFLTLLMAILTLICALRMREADIGNYQTRAGRDNSVIETFKLTLAAGKWIDMTPFALIIILAGLSFDNCIRMIITGKLGVYQVNRLVSRIFPADHAGCSDFCPLALKKHRCT
jgi:hypothetical protein